MTKTNKVTPVFIFSLPRSGSTLLQRVLMSHSKVASVAEPWLLLPFCYASKAEGVLSEYSHATSSVAFKDFIGNLPNKQQDYYEALGDFARVLYAKQCANNEVYFLDKTPRYYLIIPEIIKIFPNAKFIFLFRNPVHVMASMMQTWSDGGFRKMYRFERDLKQGPVLLSNGYKMLKGNSLAIKYEQLVSSPQESLIKICEYLEINVEESMLSLFSEQDTKGRLGDPTGVHDYQSISTDSLTKWKKTFATVFRKKVVHNYVSSLDFEILKWQGYDKDDILEEITALKPSAKIGVMDFIYMVYSRFVICTKLNIFFGRTLKKWIRKTYIS